MKDKIVKLKNGLEYCVLSEIINDRKKYCLAYQVDTDMDAVINKFIICEEKIMDGKLVLDDIHDDEERELVSNLLLTQIKEDIIQDSN